MNPIVLTGYKDMKTLDEANWNSNVSKFPEINFKIGWNKASVSSSSRLMKNGNP